IVGSVWNQGDELLTAARASAEYTTLLEFLAIESDQVRTWLHPERMLCKGSFNHEGTHPTNDDSATSASLLIGGKEIFIDAVFDGVSGHSGGWVASGIANEAFKIAAMAGWIRSPEDARMAVILADLRIHLEKEKYNEAYKTRRTVDGDRYNFYSMGTTVAISYIDGYNFYGIHCGDSDWKIVRSGAVIASSKAHGIGNTIFTGLGLGGQIGLSIQINNEDTGYSPIQLKRRDRVMTVTDGIGDVICDHESLLLLGQYPDDTDARDALVELADDRSYNNGMFDRLFDCGCAKAGGKDDDKSASIRSKLEQNRLTKLPILKTQD
ncbi:hypothetical protein HZC07_05615, partial [Candidatus Micrarchaeota archaeon]|nr:hypothetical protein [Candidatus Micrarchaeota archaeon]